MLDAKLDNISGLVMPKIKQDKFSPQQFKAKLSELRVLRNGRRFRFTGLFRGQEICY